MDYQKRIDAFEQFKLEFSGIYRPCKEFHSDIEIKSGLDEKVAAQVHLGIAIGTTHPGVIHSAVRRCVEAGCSAEEISHVTHLAAGTLSIPDLSDISQHVRDALKA